MGIRDWPERWEKLGNVCKERSLHIHNWRVAEDIQGTKEHPPALVYIAPPASSEEVAAVEKELGRSIPPSFRRVIREYSSKVDVCWMFLDCYEGGEYDNRGIGVGFPWGILDWSLERLPDVHREFSVWLTDCYDDPEDDYGRHWYGKFPVCEVGYGDFIVIEADGSNYERVIYLSHDGDTDMNGYPLAVNFEAYMDAMSQLGCPSEGTELSMFLEMPEPYLRTDCDNARQWREWFGLV